MMVGPLLGGVLVAQVGYAWTYTIDVVTYLAAVVSVYLLPPLPPQAVAGRVSARSSRLRLPGRQSNLRMTFLIDLTAMILAAPRAAAGHWCSADRRRSHHRRGPAGRHGPGAFLTGLFSAAGIHPSPGRGGVLVRSPRGDQHRGLRRRRPRRGPGGTGPADGGASVWLWAAAGCMAAAGISDAISSVFRTTILQTATPDHLRGRLQGVFIVVVAGGPAWGAVFRNAGRWSGRRVDAVGRGLACVMVAALLMRLTPGSCATTRGTRCPELQGCVPPPCRRGCDPRRIRNTMHVRDVMQTTTDNDGGPEHY